MDQPMRWRNPARVFVNSMSDLFHQDVPIDFIANVWAVMRLAEQHTFVVLTKRAERMQAVLTSSDFGMEYRDCINVLTGGGLTGFDQPLPNVWVGVSIENQKTADERIPLLLGTPAAKRVVSYEPALGDVDLEYYFYFSGPSTAGPWRDCLGRKRGGGGIGGQMMSVKPSNDIDWLIMGGESGPGARPMHPDWARSMRDQCLAAGVPFFFKQWGEWIEVRHTSQEIVDRYSKNTIAADNGDLFFKIGKKAAGRLLDGREWQEVPNDK